MPTFTKNGWDWIATTRTEMMPLKRKLDVRGKKGKRESKIGQFRQIFLPKSASTLGNVE